MARVRVMYWKEIPVQVQAEDGDETVSRPLAPVFQESVDAIAMFDGSAGSDDYLDAWEWGPYSETALSAPEAADAAADRYNAGIPADFVARIRDLHRDGRRNESPGSIEDWFDA